ncbi:multidrug transporter subunit MdtO [Jeongeupia sp. HS-3]|uniref:FUSC family protein n=1 Tax=Jeongeupia sp. HS-3 TaxID=1009682 RepID=UPI0018A4A60B|nr:FUSC family protein [Jeongeupia sp. HS-3]BCL74913.1 multidrug transporter subunit MdtO [Jeongeupia sp. HS-3]
MSETALKHPTASRWWQLLCTELAPFPGRGDAVLRYVVSSAIIIVISMGLQIPFLALSLIMVFFTAQDNTVMTKLSGVMLMLGGTLAISLAILLLKYTFDTPMLRIIGASVIVFAGMYFMRISKLGAIGYLTALLIIYSQSFVDEIQIPELLIRVTLYSWVATIYPIFITMAVNALLRPADSRVMLRDEMARQLDDVVAVLDACQTGSAMPRFDIAKVERGVLSLHRHLAFAAMGDKTYQRDKTRHQLRITTVDRLHTAAVHLSHQPTSLTDVDTLRAAVSALRQAIVDQQTFRLDAPLPASDDSTLREMADALQSLAELADTPLPAAPADKGGLIVADAWTNPVYPQFALKTLLAALICYVFYTATHWQGIHTSMLTCIIVALPSLGAVAQKGLLRIGGCLVGSLLTLLATVFVIPYIDSITGLLMLSLPIIALGSWVAAGSPRSNYAGLQIVFAFALALLEGFGPVTDLTEIRDRLIGILVGILVSYVVYTFIWPEREGDALRALLGKLLRSIAALAVAGRDAASVNASRLDIAKARTQGWSLLASTREMQSRIAAEPGVQVYFTTDTHGWFVEVRQALFAVNRLQTALSHDDEPDGELHRLGTAVADAAAERLQSLASAFEQHAPSPASPMPAAVAAFDTALARHATPHTELMEAVHAVAQRLSQLHSSTLAQAADEFAASPA